MHGPKKNGTLVVSWSNSSINTHELDIMLVPDSMTPRLNFTLHRRFLTAKCS